MSQIETVIRASKQLEQLLEKHHGANGRGLHEKASSIEAQLDSDTLRGLRKIATLRNKVVHEEFEIEDLAAFEATTQQLVAQLQPKASAKSAPKTKAVTKKPSSTTTDTAAATQREPKCEPKREPSNAAQPATATASPKKTTAAKPRTQVQPRVQLPQTADTPTRKTTRPEARRPEARHPNQQQAATGIAFVTLLPAVSGLLIFLAIVWILAK